jgi:hypothetical protein
VDRDTVGSFTATSSRLGCSSFFVLLSCPGSVAPGQSYQFTVMPDAAACLLSIALIFVQTDGVSTALASERAALAASAALCSRDDISTHLRRVSMVCSTSLSPCASLDTLAPPLRLPKRAENRLAGPGDGNGLAQSVTRWSKRPRREKMTSATQPPPILARNRGQCDSGLA